MARRIGERITHSEPPGWARVRSLRCLEVRSPGAATNSNKASMRMGTLLARLGFDVMTGGYQGVMEAVSRGAHDNGAHVVGITMARFEDRVNRYARNEVRTANFYERFRWLVDRADAYVAMGGGIGTSPK